MTKIYNMQHSVKFIGIKYQELSDMRKDVIRFNADDFLQFAKQNESKYHIIENGDDCLVSSWYSDELIKGYQKSIGLEK